MESAIKQRIQAVLQRFDSNPTQFAKAFNLNQKTVHNQINANTQLSASIILLILEYYPTISAEWLMRGKGEMFLSEKSEETASSEEKNEELQFLRERIISLEAENKVLREVAGLQRKKKKKGKSAW